jgi:hypothetical protein
LTFDGIRIPATHFNRGRHSFEAVSGHLLIAAIGLEPGHADADRHLDPL